MLTILAVAGTLLLLAAVVLWRLRASRREKKPDPAGFMTLEQITRLQSPSDGATLMKVAQPKPVPSKETASVAKHTSSPSDAYMSDLEKQFPRIAERLVTIWPDPESETYLQSLTFDDRGDREGFGTEVASDIMALYGLKMKQSNGVWL